MKSLLFAATILACVVNPYGADGKDWSVTVETGGSVRIERNGQEAGTISANLFEVPWKGGTTREKVPSAKFQQGRHSSQILAPSGGIVDVEVNSSVSAADLRLEYRLTPRQALKLNSLNVTLRMPASMWAGGSFSAGDKRGQFPLDYKSVQLYSATASTLRLAPPGGTALKLDFADAPHLLIQDDRSWHNAFSVRMEQAKTSATWPAGKTMTLAFTLGAESGMSIEEDKPVTITAGDEWLPLDADLEIEAGSALDFSKVIPRHVPAGKYGRVIVTRQGKFGFEKRATPARFYGVNFCSTAQYLPHELADRLAERLMRMGYNAVRVHHYESTLVERAPGSIRFKADRLDEFDYLFAKLKERGIYVTTDLFVSRPVALADVYEGESGMFEMNDFKMAVHVNERAFENYKTFSRMLLEHVNPYTKLRYADDPALAWLSLVNEDCPGNFTSKLTGKLLADWQRAWNRWLAARYPSREALAQALGNLAADQDPAKGSVPLQNIPGKPSGVSVFNSFLADVEQDFYERTRRFLREELHCNALLTDCNAWTNPVQLQAVRDRFDYVDDHFYVDHPHFLDQRWKLPSRCPNANPIAGGATGGRPCAFTRVLGKPFTITEFNYSAPGRFRGVGGILTGALGAVQDWDGLWRFAYSHSRDHVTEPGAMNYFDVSADPLNQAAERASLCLFVRGDLQPAKHAVSITADPASLIKTAGPSRDKTPSWHGMAWLARVGWRFDGKPAKGELPLAFSNDEKSPLETGTEKQILAEFAKNDWLAKDNHTDFEKKIFQSDNGQLTVDAESSTLTLDTVLTAGGFAPAGKKIQTRAATIEILDTDATVWISSLDGKPIAASRHLLITHLTDLQNSGALYAGRSRQVLLAWGKLPYLVRAGRATVALNIRKAGQAKVYALTAGGKRAGEVAVTAKDNTLNVPLAVANNGKARMLYEVEIGR